MRGGHHTSAWTSRSWMWRAFQNFFPILADVPNICTFSEGLRTGWIFVTEKAETADQTKHSARKFLFSKEYNRSSHDVDRDVSPACCESFFRRCGSLNTRHLYAISKAQLWLDRIPRLWLVHFRIRFSYSLLPHGSPDDWVFDRRHPGFWYFKFTVPVNIFRAKSYVNCFFHPACVEMGVTINILYSAPERAMSSSHYYHHKLFGGSVFLPAVKSQALSNKSKVCSERQTPSSLSPSRLKSFRG